ncbi:hypothetical protein N9R79_07960 [Vibrio sp.]|nr:hypothetical protein [Vibrio sp.]
MARIPAEERAANKELYDNLLLDILLNKGADALNYTELNKKVVELGKNKVPLATLQRYYPTTKDMLSCLDGKFKGGFINALDYSSEEAFYASWRELFKTNDLFRVIVQVVIGISSTKHYNTRTGVLTDKGKVKTLERINMFKLMLDSQFGIGRGEIILNQVFGDSVIYGLTME